MSTLISAIAPSLFNFLPPWSLLILAIAPSLFNFLPPSASWTCDGALGAGFPPDQSSARLLDMDFTMSQYLLPQFSFSSIFFVVMLISSRTFIFFFGWGGSSSEGGTISTSESSTFFFLTAVFTPSDFTPTPAMAF